MVVVVGGIVRVVAAAATAADHVLLFNDNLLVLIVVCCVCYCIFDVFSRRTYQHLVIYATVQTSMFFVTSLHFVG